MHDQLNANPAPKRVPWNKGKLTGAKPPLRPKHVWSIRKNSRSKVALATSPCSIWQSTVSSVAVMSSPSESKTSPQADTRRIAQRSGKRKPGGLLDLSEQTRQAVDDHLKVTGKRPGEFLFTGHRGPARSMTTRQYARLVSEWIGSVGLDPRLFGTHSLRRTKATLIYRRTGNLRTVQLLLGHNKIESTVRYLGIEVDDAIAIAEQVDV